MIEAVFNSIGYQPRDLAVTKTVSISFLNGGAIEITQTFNVPDNHD
jgi:hypothetical protein